MAYVSRLRLVGAWLVLTCAAASFPVSAQVNFAGVWAATYSDHLASI